VSVRGSLNRLGPDSSDIRANDYGLSSRGPIICETRHSSLCHYI